MVALLADVFQVLIALSHWTPPSRVMPIRRCGNRPPVTIERRKLPALLRSPAAVRAWKACMARTAIKPGPDSGSLVAIEGHTRAGTAFTTLILETFQLNGRLLVAGDRLTKSVGLTSARWQVMGRLNRTQHPLTVSHIARTMGLQRQSVQRTVDLLASEGLVTLVENPHHVRSKLVALTQLGREKLKKVERLQVTWANRIADGISAGELNAAIMLMRNLRHRLGGRGNLDD